MGNQSIFKRLRDAAPTLSVGVLTGNLLALGGEVSLMESAGVQLVHVDVMDGCFCPPMTVGPPFIKAIKTSLLKDVHLMIADPSTRSRTTRQPELTSSRSTLKAAAMCIAFCKSWTH